MNNKLLIEYLTQHDLEFLISSLIGHISLFGGRSPRHHDRYRITSAPRRCRRRSRPSMGRVTSEYGRLTRVLVGRADGFRLPAHEHEPLLEERNVHGTYTLVGRPYPKDVIETANASLDELCCKLREWQPSIDIVRSDMTSEKNHTEMAGNRGYSTRDVMVVVHDTLYLCPTLHQSRSTEAEDCFPHVIDEFARRGKVVDLRTRRWRELCDDEGSSLRAKSEATERAFLMDLRAQAAAADAASSTRPTCWWSTTGSCSTCRRSAATTTACSS